MGLLSLAIWTPIAFGVLLLAFGRDKHAGAVRWLALVGALAGFAVTLPLYDGFKPDTPRSLKTKKPKVTKPMCATDE